MQIVKRGYDFAGRKTFESYPKRGYAGLSEGIQAHFDALGRPTATRTSSELGTLTTVTAYEGGFQTRQTDARQQASVYSYQAFDEPVDTAIMRCGERKER